MSTKEILTNEFYEILTKCHLCESIHAPTSHTIHNSCEMRKRPWRARSARTLTNFWQRQCSNPFHLGSKRSSVELFTPLTTPMLLLPCSPYAPPCSPCAPLCSSNALALCCHHALPHAPPYCHPMLSPIRPHAPPCLPMLPPCSPPMISHAPLPILSHYTPPCSPMLSPILSPCSPMSPYAPLPCLPMLPPCFPMSPNMIPPCSPP